MKVYYLMDYLPSRYESSKEQEQDRKAIYCFKNGACCDRILQGLADGIRRFANPNTVICFVPASTHAKTQRRYQNVSSRLQQMTGFRCSYSAITKPEDSESGYMAGKSENPASSFNFDATFFSGKRVILIDDVITRGRTLEGTAQRLKDAGATEVIGLVVGRTINPDWDGPENRNVEKL